MGVGPGAQALYQRLSDRGLMKPGSVCELGSQDAYTTSFDGSRGWMESLGWEYDCIDLDGRHNAIRIDLNEPYLPNRQYDLVTNHGTTEHVFDQANCFKIIHDLTKSNGIMIHIVPTQEYLGHAFYRYDKEFFKAIAKYNRYEILELYDLREGDGLLVVVVLRKTNDDSFIKPMQGVYESLNGSICT